MSFIRNLMKRLKDENEDEMEGNKWIKNPNFDAKKEMVRNILKAIVKVMKPLLKVSLLGVLLDLLPSILRLRNVNIKDQLLKFYNNFSIKQFISKRYPKSNSWLTALVSSVLISQLFSPTIPKYPIEPTNNNIFNLSLYSSKDSKMALNRTEFELIIKQFLSSLISSSVGVYLLRFSHVNKGKILNSKHHLATSFYLFIQAAYSLWSFQKLRTIKLLRPWQINTPWLNFNLNLVGNFSEIILFSWSSYKVMMSWFYHPNTLPKSFVNWINKFAEIDPILLDYLRALEFNQISEGAHTNLLNNYCISHGLDTKLGDPYYGLLSCKLLHPLNGTNCYQHTYHRFIFTFMRSLISMYIPLNLLTFIIKYTFKKNESDENKQPFLSLIKDKVLFPSMQSSAFLGTFVATMFGSICFTRHKFKTDIYDARVGSMICGFISILIEAPSRRLPLTLYLLPRALASAYYIHILPYIPAQLIDTPLMVMSLATLLTCFKLQPLSIQPPIRPLLNWVYDKKVTAKASSTKGSSPDSTPTPETCLELIQDI